MMDGYQQRVEKHTSLKVLNIFTVFFFFFNIGLPVPQKICFKQLQGPVTLLNTNLLEAWLSHVERSLIAVEVLDLKY